MRRYTYTLSLFVYLCLVSCTNVISTIDEKIPAQIERITIVRNTQNTEKEESFVPGNYGKYVQYLESSDFLVGISSSKISPLDAPRTKAFAGYTDCAQTKGAFNGSGIKVNGEPFPTPFDTKSSSGRRDSVFGKKISISIPGNSTKASSDSNMVELYAPKEIEILSPKIDAESSLLPLIYYDGLVVRWNEDLMNKNGVLFILEWTGEVVVGQDSPETTLRRTFIAKDTGKTILDSHLFDGIPDTAVCHLTVVRGDIDLTSIDGVSYKVLVESHEFFTFVLIREINKRT